jgi:predicted ATPase
MAWALWLQAKFCCELRDRPGARAAVERLQTLVRGAGSSVGTMMALGYGGWALAEDDDHEAACAELQRGHEELLGRGHRMMGTFLLGLLADALLQAGRPREALRWLNTAVEMMEATGERLWEPELYRLRGMALASAGDAAGAEGWLVRALALARERQNRLSELRAGTDLARLWARQDRRQDAHDLLVRIYAWFTEGFNTPDLREAKALLDALAHHSWKR